MRKSILTILFSALLFTNCGNYNALLKSDDYDLKYEAAKAFFAEGKYQKASTLLEETYMIMKGTDKAEESLYMLGMAYYNMRDYETTSLYLDRYAKSYSKGKYTEIARLYSAKSNYMESPDERLDQSPTMSAINKIQEFLDFYPYSTRKEEATDMLYELQDRLVLKEYESAQLYYNLGSYTGNCTNGGSNFQACIITAENALKSYPYTSLREDLYMMILRARYQLAKSSVIEKVNERYRETIDEYYGFKNQYPDSKYSKEAENIFKHSNAKINKKGDSAISEE